MTHADSVSADAWLVAVAGDGVPAALVERMRAALRDAATADAATDVPASLAAAAMSCLRAALPRCDHRDAALHLLAADALMTAACEAAAEAGTERLHALCAEYDVARLAAMASDSAGAGA